MLSEPIVLKSLSVETYQYLVQIQQNLNLDSPAHAIQHVLNDSCRKNAHPKPVSQLPAEYREQLIKMMVGLEQCQTWLSDMLLILHTLTTLTPIPTEISARPNRRKATGAVGKKRDAQPVDILPLSLNQLQRGVTGIVLAVRLGVSSATVSRKRSDSNFNKWSQERDPAGIPWTYSGATRRFHPITPLSIELDNAASACYIEKY